MTVVSDTELCHLGEYESFECLCSLEPLINVTEVGEERQRTPDRRNEP